MNIFLINVNVIIDFVAVYVYNVSLGIMVSLLPTDFSVRTSFHINMARQFFIFIKHLYLGIVRFAVVLVNEPLPFRMIIFHVRFFDCTAGIEFVTNVAVIIQRYAVVPFDENPSDKTIRLTRKPANDFVFSDVVVCGKNLQFSPSNAAGRILKVLPVVKQIKIFSFSCGQMPVRKVNPRNFIPINGAALYHLHFFAFDFVILKKEQSHVFP